MARFCLYPPGIGDGGAVDSETRHTFTAQRAKQAFNLFMKYSLGDEILYTLTGALFYWFKGFQNPGAVDLHPWGIGRCPLSEKPGTAGGAS